MAGTRTAFRRLLVALAAVVAALLAATTGLMLWLNTDGGRDALLSRLDAMLGQSGLSLAVDAPDGWLPYRLEAAALRLGDTDGVWLRAERVELRWNPWALLAGRLTIHAAGAATIVLDRPPVMAAAEAPAAAGVDVEPLRWLLRTRLERLAVGRLELGPAWLGEPAAWEISGELGAAAAEGPVHRLLVRRVDGREDRLEVRVAQDRSDGTLELRAELVEAPGGPLARRLGIDADAGLSLSLAGDGAGAAWRGRLDATAGDASAALELRRDGADEPLGIEGRIVPAGLLPEPLAALAGDGVELRADARYESATARLQIDRLRLASSALRVEGRGLVALEEDRLEGEATLTEALPDALAPLLGADTARGLRIEVAAAGAPAAPQLRVAARADALALAGVEAGELRVTAEAVPGNGGWELLGRADAGRLAWSLEGTGPLVRGPAALAFDGRVDEGDRLVLERLELTLPDARATGRAEVGLADGALRAPLELRITDLTALAGLTRLDLAGAARFDVALARAAADAPLTIAVNGDTDGLTLELPVVRALVSPAMTLAARVVLDDATGLAIGGVRLAGARATATADLRIPPGLDRLEGEALVDVLDTAVLAPELGLALAGPGTARGRFDGPLADPAISGTIEVAAVRVGPLGGTGLEGAYELTRLASGVTGPVRASVRRGPDRVLAEGRIALGDATFDVDALRATGPGASLAGELSLALDGGPAAGEITLALTDLGALLRETPFTGAGRGNALVRLYAEDGGQGGSLTLAGEGLRLRRGRDPLVAAAAIEAEGRLTPSAAGEAISLDARARDVHAPSSRLEAVELTLRGDRARARLTLDTRGTVLEAPADLSAELVARLDGAGPEFVIERLGGSLAGQPLESHAPVRLAFPDGGFELEGLSLDVGGGSLAGEARLGLPTPRLEVTARKLPLALASLVDPRLEIDGALSGEVSMSGTGRATAGRFAVSLDPVSFARRRRAAALTATAEGQLRDGRLSLHATAAPVAGPPATLRGDVPLAVDLEALTVSQPAGEALDARLEWQGDAADLMVMLPMNDHVLRGPARLALWLGGQAGAPALSGEVTLEGGYYEHLVAGTVLTPLELRLVGDGDSLSIDRLEAGTGDGGRITGSGELGLDRAARFPASLRFDFARARLIRRDELTTVGDGQITVSGPVLAPAVAGRLELREVEARLQNSLPPEVVQLELVESTARRRGSAHGGGVPEERAPAAEPEGAGSLAVEIRMPQRVFVRGLGIDSEWQGRLELGGTPAQPSVTGRIELVRGVMFFLGRRFRLQDSVIRFPGGGEIEPELDVQAVYEGRYYVVTVAITGPASASEIKLTSVPELPESEILSQALFSKSTGELTALEAVQLAGAVSELTGRSGGPGQLLGRVRQAVGIDVLRFGSRETETGEQATSVEAGVYVAEGLYLGAETSTAEESGVVSVEYELTERIRVKTDLEQTGGQNIGIEYKRDY